MGFAILSPLRNPLFIRLALLTAMGTLAMSNPIPNFPLSCHHNPTHRFIQPYHHPPYPKHICAQCGVLRPRESPLPQPATPPSILHLPIDPDIRSPPPTHSPPEATLSHDNPLSLGPFTSTQDGTTVDHRSSPLPAEKWLDLGSMPLAEPGHFDRGDGVVPHVAS